MGLFGFGEKKKITCPECRSRGAVKTMTSVKCPNSFCSHYDSSLLPSTDTLPTMSRPGSVLRGSFNPGGNAVTVRYRNHCGEDAEYVGDRTSIRVRKMHVTIRVAPTGKRITLAKKFITNLASLPLPEPSQIPSAVERQILSYHSKRGTTSPRYAEARRKYPNWQP